MLKKKLAKSLANYVVKQNYEASKKAEEKQKKVFNKLIRVGKNTIYGNDFGLKDVKTYEDFKKVIPIVDYEGLRPYIERVKNGEKNVLWRGRPIYFSKTSGTTSGVKYIPITKESIGTHIKGARNTLLHYIHESGSVDFLGGKIMFLQGSPKLLNTGGIKTGRLSGIVAYHVPSYLKKNRLPSFNANMIEDWEEKLKAIIEETKNQDMTLIGGIPSWVQMYFEQLEKINGVSVKELFPNLELYVHGGVNYSPYENIFKKYLPNKTQTIETYPASEGFIAFQDTQTEEGLLLNLYAGIFYEFIPVNEFHEKKPKRLSLSEVKLGENYVVILNTIAGLWGYNIGDTVKFTSISPYRIKVTGRLKHYISAFGEHVISEEVDSAISEVMKKYPCKIIEYTVAPQVSPTEGLPYHQWFIEFETEPKDLKQFSLEIDNCLRKKNIYYDDLIRGIILKPLVISTVKRDGFKKYMQSIGKLGGQNKVPRITNDRKIPDILNELGMINITS